MLQHVDGYATEVLRRLEDVRSAEEAQGAAQAFRAWIASGMVATPPLSLMRSTDRRKPRPDRREQRARKRSSE